MSKRILCLLLAFMLPVAAGAELVMAGYDPSSLYRDWNTNSFFARMEEWTGVEFTFRQYGAITEWAAAKSAMTADGDLPDVLFKAELTPAECIAMLDAGVLIDLAPYLQANCPNLYAMLSAHPEWLEAITLPDGRIAALPAINESRMQNCLWINRKWLDTVKLSVPTDLESLENVLTAFLTGDPNQNGKSDEIPLAFIGAFDLKFLAHAFGLTANDYNVYAKDGTAYFMPLSEEFKPFIEWCAKLYGKGLLDQDGFTTSDTMRTISESDDPNPYGIIITTMVTSILPSEWLADYVVVPPFEYNGKQIYRDFVGPVLSGTFAVTSACGEPETVLQWADRLYTKEGSLLASVGVQGTDYVIDGDGTWRLTDSASSDSYFSSSALISTGGTAPGWAYDEFQRLYSDKTLRLVSEQLDLVNAVAERPFPYFSLSAAQEEFIAPLQAAIGTYVDESIARFVTGEWETTEEQFAAFESGFDELGLSDFMSFWQQILDGVNK